MSNVKRQFKLKYIPFHGLKHQLLTAEHHEGELVYSTDTKELFISIGSDKPLQLVGICPYSSFNIYQYVYVGSISLWDEFKDTLKDIKSIFKTRKP